MDPPYSKLLNNVPPCFANDLNNKNSTSITYHSSTTIGNFNASDSSLNVNAKTFYPRSDLITSSKASDISYYDLLKNRTRYNKKNPNLNHTSNTPSINKLKIYYQNVRGLRTKLKKLACSIAILNYDIYLFSETWLNQDIANSELGFQNFTVYRCDRNPNTSTRKTGGGVLIAVRNSIQSKLLNIQRSDVETIFVLIKLKGQDYILNCTYIPPSNPINIYSSFSDSVNEVLSTHNKAKVLITGDLNLPDVKWVKNNVGVMKPTGSLSTLEDFIISALCFLNNLNQFNSTCNEKGDLLDLCFSNVFFKYIFVDKAKDTLLIHPDNYHPPLAIDIKYPNRKPKYLNAEIKNSINYSFDYKKGNYLAISNEINSIDWKSNLSDFQSINDALSYFYDKINDILQKHIPVREHKASLFPPWVSSELKNLIFDKKIAHKLYKINKSNEHKTNFNKLRKQCRQKSLLDYSNYIKKTETDLKSNPRNFWHLTLSKRKEDDSSSHNMVYKDKSSSDPEEIAEMFALKFSNAYSSEYLASPQFEYANSLITPLSGIYIERKHISSSLNKLKQDSTSGPDNVPPIVLKNCANAFSYPLHELFNWSLSLGVFPKSWKTSYVIPISKGGDKSNVENYRPIAKISTIPKVLESIIYDKISPILSPLISDNQHGFTIKKSTTSNLLSFVQHVNYILEQGLQFDCCQTDYSSAFDKININILCSKLQAYGITDPLLSWLYAYLSDRRQIVKLKSSKNKINKTSLSKPFEALSGVIQGGHLSGLLFNIYINDVCETILSDTTQQNLKLWMYADDKRLGLAIKSSTDHELLQNVLNNIYQWCQANKLVLNVNKCKVITYHHKKNPSLYNYEINGTKLPRVNECRDLGVLFQSDFRFNNHYSNIKNKALRVLGFINRNSRDFKDPLTYKVLYFTLVRPILEYASQVWSPQYKEHIDFLEMVQRKFLKSLAYKQKIKPKNIFNHCDYNLVLRTNNMTTLEKRRQAYDLIFFYKIMNHKVYLPELLENIAFRINFKNTRNQDMFCLKSTHTNFMKFSPLFRMIDMYNTIAKDFHQIDIFHLTLQQYKEKIFTALSTQ